MKNRSFDEEFSEESNLGSRSPSYRSKTPSDKEYDFHTEFDPTLITKYMRVGDSFDRHQQPISIEQHKQNKARNIIKTLNPIMKAGENKLTRFYGKDGLQSYARKQQKETEAQLFSPETLQTLITQHATKNVKYIPGLYSPFLSTTSSLPSLLNNTMTPSGDWHLRQNVLGKAPYIGIFDVPQNQRTQIPIQPNNTNPEAEKEVLYNDSFSPITNYQKKIFNNPLLGQIESRLQPRFQTPFFSSDQKAIQQYNQLMNLIPSNTPLSSDQSALFKNLRGIRAMYEQDMEENKSLSPIKNQFDRHLEKAKYYKNLTKPPVEQYQEPIRRPNIFERPSTRENYMSVETPTTTPTDPRLQMRQQAEQKKLKCGGSVSKKKQKSLLKLINQRI